ncbi:MAG: hypothetical protein R6U64_04405 [Bacteroidales bacterium]
MKLIKKTLVIFLLPAIMAGMSYPAKAGSTKQAREVHLEGLFNQTMHALYDFDFQRADAISTGMLQLDSTHYISHFARASYLWWMIITHPLNQHLEQQYAATIARAQDGLPQGEDQPQLNVVFYHISIYAMEAQMSLRQKEYLRIMKNLRACTWQVKYSMGKERQHQGFMLTSGLYNYMTGYAQVRFPVLSVFKNIFPEGDMQLGLDQLQLAALSDNLTWKTEARFLLMKIYLEMEKQPLKALDWVNWLIETYPRNLTYRYYHYMILKAMKDPGGMARVKNTIKKLALTHQGLSQDQREYFLQLAAD